MAKYNWTYLKNSFLNGDWRGLKDFAEAKKIPYKTLTARARGWLEEKQERERKKSEEMGQRMLERAISREIEREFSRNSEVLEVHDNLITALRNLSPEKLQRMAIEAPRSFSSLTNALMNLQKIHRVAEGLDLPQANGDKDDLPKIVFEIKDTSIKRNEEDNNSTGV